MSGAVASLPMYNLPEMAQRNAAFWSALAGELRQRGVTGLPEHLLFTRPAVPDSIGPETVFTQTCGYPLQTIYRGQYRLLAVPDYDAPGCGDFTHRAFILVRDASRFHALPDLRGTVFAVNSGHSNSGMNLPRALFARIAGGRPFFGSVIETGTHPFSMRRVMSGEADAASVDCLTYAFFRDHRPDAVAGLRILAETPASPSIPFVTSAATPKDQVEALTDALLALSDGPRHRPMLRALRITRIARAQPDTYARILDYARDARELDYPDLV